MTYKAKIVDTGKDVKDENLNPYEFALLSTKFALKEKSQGVTSSDVAHGVTGGFPLVLDCGIRDSNTVDAAADARVDATNVDITGDTFYRIFNNKQSVS